MRKELQRLSETLVWRGLALLALGVGALLWPEPLMIAALLTAGLIAAMLGLYEMAIAAVLRRFTQYWYVVLVHGLTSLAFGLLTVGASALPLRVALVLIVAWLLVYVGVMWGAATMMWPMRTVPWALIAWGTADLLVSIAIAISPTVTIFGFLFLGALYAAVFGAWQLALGWWLGRHAPAIIVDQVSATILHRVHQSSADTRRRVLSVR
jgi:uncharacterized membrane protein HdeD (DUF308 family)